ncbi:hypothetical protein LY01_02687 [Nonlabens xylanidelens]|uniref:Uncharacterized protein n=1 Tax=Nonlabens xylanidelens TaxID=191564 RepID=A0A2S6IFK8_9FLAO|nr:hypothetical protein LY01_02687 [Nonlabens xylanidelens]
MYYSENYCHQTGENSYGKTSMRYPILNSDYENKDNFRRDLRIL